MLSITLNSPWFELVRDGKKKYEGRRRTEKLLALKCGDRIEIHNHTDKTRQPYFFRQALETLPIQDVLPVDNISVDEGVRIYHQYVSQATQERDGVVMIKIRQEV